MNLNIFQWRSIKTRVALFTMVIFLVSTWSLAFYANRVLHRNMERMEGEHQSSIVTFMANGINDEFKFRIKALEQYVTGRMDPSMLDIQQM